MENSRKETRHYSWLSGPLARGKLFVTTYNAGFAEPPDLALWLEKALECDVAVIGMQETKAATWLEKINQYLGKADFQLITLNTMWRV